MFGELKEGDKVRFLDDVGGGIVVELCEDGCVLVRDENGMDVPVLPSAVTRVCDADDDLLATRKVRRKFEKTKGGQESHKTQRTTSSELVEIDLHSAMIGISEVMSPHDQKKRQLEMFRRTMNKLRNKKGLRIIFIHGKGEGILRAEILEELKHKYKTCIVQDAPFSRYGIGGATEVIIN